ncbi:MAG: CBS domain-containing protein [Algicola sp.]|nr:CBS domain-containing protein [Algicola sp.]
MKNTISERIADFLKNYPPFNAMEPSQLEQLSVEVVIKHKETNDIVFSQSEDPHEHFYVVNKGAVSLSKAGSSQILDICDEGDVFGLRPLLAHENYKLEAKAYEETILYAIPIKDFKPLALENKRIGNFLIESFASNTGNPYSIKHRGKLYGVNEEVERYSTNKILDLQPIKYSSELITCNEDATIKAIADTMTKHNVSCILVEKDSLPVGIITDKDLRKKVATGQFPISESAKTIMSSPIITYPKGLTLAQSQMAMMKSSISHLVLTEDGTTDTPAVGILSKHDIMVAVGNNPAVLIRAIKRAATTKRLRGVRHGTMNLLQGYLDQNIPLGLVSKIISELNDASTKQIIQLALAKMEREPPVKFTWLSMGSQGRGEQLLNTDQDNAIIFEDVPDDKLEETRSYFLKLGERISKSLNIIGFEYCPADMMASNPSWCQSLSEWKKVTSHWIHNPGPNEILLSSIFFDFNVTYGEKAMADELSLSIFDHAKQYPQFLTHLASGALQNPSPSGFFRDFLVEQDGEHKDFFDLKLRALMPIIDAARVLILSHSIKSINNTSDRYEKLAELEPNNKELYLACSYASKALLKFRTRQGLLHNDSGRYIALDKLNKEEKIKLKRTFKTIKEIQSLIEVRFQVKNLLR